jgi:FkbM family methyltransferase
MPSVKSVLSYTRLLGSTLRARLRNDHEGYAERRRILALQLLQAMSRDDVELVGFRRQGREWLASIHGGPVSSMLFRCGHFQGDEIDALLAWLKATGRLEGRTHAIDVGANIGTTTVPLADAGLEVIAIEPMTNNFDLLSWHVKRNGLTDRVTLVFAAVAREPGELQMAFDAGNWGGSEVVGGAEPPPFARPDTVVRVPALPLSQILSQNHVDPAKVALVWSDTQGFETEVLASGRELWAAGVPIWVELWPRGLNRHSGVGPFVEAVKADFDGWLTCKDLKDMRRDARPIAELAAFVDSIGDGEAKSSDALLIPIKR